MSIKPNSTTLVDLGSYKLEVTVHGPPRRAHNPIVIIIPDIGSSIKEWTAVTEILACSMSVVNYERAGYGQSEPVPAGKPRSPAALAEELHLLLRAAKIAPPYIMISHSYSSAILREFTKLRNLAQFKGFVFVDAKSDPKLEARRLGIDTLYGDNHRLSDTAWQALLDEEARAEHKAAVGREIAEYQAMSSGEEHEYGRVPLIVLQSDVNGEEISDNGGDKSLLKLSERSKLRPMMAVGRDIQLVAPELVADAVTWILMQYRC
ncbi:uncharacterized protein B0J16DRAFT_330248 [Fusarium flagelliforme]|uniref:Alpha/beta hydrolase n=1 Tax=Fusarium flagelliforme TaxID=2675880 RepID=A0A395N564_9HYPO|nr:uncharacterized protein B0J16DRAFT_330248 [Fusarium flagelliforme]KAH7198333.1 hypothetical protein B0J16DRAFT_330248 [Fusarium flagelliforme]RFN55266.1 alpha/beta hydrolase [Fusarium flagelliforme]